MFSCYRFAALREIMTKIHQQQWILCEDPLVWVESDQCCGKNAQWTQIGQRPIKRQIWLNSDNSCWTSSNYFRLSQKSVKYWGIMSLYSFFLPYIQSLFRFLLCSSARRGWWLGVCNVIHTEQWNSSSKYTVGERGKKNQRIYFPLPARTQNITRSAVLTDSHIL